MSNYVVYHNTETRGYSLESGPTWGIVTRKPLCREAFNGFIWVIAGTGEKGPKQYHIHHRFVAEHVDPIEDWDNEPDFIWKVYGDTGRNFDPPILLNGRNWFRDFLFSMGNFGIGFARMPEEFLSEFEAFL